MVVMGYNDAGPVIRDVLGTAARAEVGAVVENLRGNAAAQRPLHRDVHLRIEPPVLVQNRQ